MSTIPQGFTTVTPHLVVSPCKKALEFYQQAFGAVVRNQMTMPNSDVIMHAEMQIGNAVIMLADAFPDYGVVGPDALGGSPVTIHLYVDDVDAAMKRAEGAGAKVTFPVADQFWGDRYGKLKDPFGHHWSIATHLRDPSPEEIRAAAEAMFGNS
ncbi:MAG: VOC family protein [Acidobacteria bacterium]|nr:VOC family protein [Acidobacteriota bacterium]